MKRRLSYTVGLIALGVLVFAPRPADAQTVAPGPYYANPSWDQKLQCDTQATCPRFIVLSNWNSDAVLDRETGLVWEKSPSTSTVNFSGAVRRCNTLTVGNRKGWRLPTIQELASLVDPTQNTPALPAGHPFSNVLTSNTYWSANHRDDSVGWVVFFLNGGAVDVFFGQIPWCVRGGQGVNPQLF
jgi:hypothetical protein